MVNKEVIAKKWKITPGAISVDISVNGGNMSTHVSYVIHMCSQIR
jgi:hypothetical protein